MGTLHLTFDELSALFDGELLAQAETSARQHLRDCPKCSAEYSLSVRLERDLRQPPVLSCDTALELISADFDGQAGRPDRATSQRHLAACESCRAQVQTWSSVRDVLRALPAGRPSADVDQSIARLANPPRRAVLPAFRGAAARVAIAGTAIVAVVLSGLPLTRLPVALPGLSEVSDRVIVAAAQQIVYNAKNNTLYQLDTGAAAVNAREPGTNELRASIAVGGMPIRLALNEAANTILVLDAVQKRVTEIDAVSNTVIGATTVDVPGTATSINVDTSGKILVTSVSTPSASSAPVGTVSVLDSTTKQLQTVREMDVAPRMVVVDAFTNQAVLVSGTTTKLVDSSYKVIATLPGGVAAAFSRRGDGVAVLSAAGADAMLTFAGAAGVLPALRLQGSPRAIIGVKEGGYLVLLQQPDGQGRVVKVSPEGTAVASVGVAIAGGDLIYDEATNYFTVANGGAITSAIGPTLASAGLASPTANATTQSSPSASPSTSPEPAKSENPNASAAAASSAADVLSSAKLIAPGLYAKSLPSGVQPHLMATIGSRVWFLDQANNVSVFDMRTGETRGKVATLRADAHVDYWVAGRSFVFGVDAANAQVHVVNTVTERADSYATNLLSPVAAVVVGLDDRLWLALRDASYLLAWNPRTFKADGFDLEVENARASALTLDTAGRVVYSDDARALVGTLNPTTKKLSEVCCFSRRGTTTALVVDRSGTLWLGTSTGDLWSVRGGTPKLVMNVRTPVSSLSLDRDGRAWFLAPIPNGIGFGYGPADGSEAVRSLPGPAVGLAFSEGGSVVSADPRGAFYIGTEAGR
jgi:anti-sigma factor RsiW/streptogramin lyase